MIIQCKCGSAATIVNSAPMVSLKVEMYAPCCKATVRQTQTPPRGG